jgi:hypothetical protein
VCEKLAFEGVTRFEDRDRLPMGICINLTAYAAKLCFQAAYNPMMMGPYLAFGTATHLMVQDASAFAGEGEELSFWQMQVGFNQIQSKATNEGLALALFQTLFYKSRYSKRCSCSHLVYAEHRRKDKV